MTSPIHSLMTAAALLGATLTPSFAQEITQPFAQPVGIVSGQSGGAGASGGITSGGASVEAPAPAPVEPAQPLPPGPAAGEPQASYLSNPAIIGGAVAVTAIVVCALVCFNHSSSTTSTNMQH